MPTKYDPRRKRTPSTGAGVYSGYSSNFKPTGSSKNSKYEPAAIKLLQSIVGSGGKPQTIKAADGRSYTVTMQEGGASGVVGAAARALTKAATSGAAGKTSTAVAKDAAKSASRRTAAESATIRQGNAAAKTPEMARKLEQQSAAASASKSVNTAPRSSVVPRTGTSTGSLSRGITQKRLAEFSADKGKRIAGTAKSKRTAKERAQAQADLEDTLKRGAQARAEGRKPGEDIPAATGRGIYDPVPAPRSTPRQADRALISKALTKPRNPGKNASAAKQEKYQKDLAEYNKRQADMKAKTKDIDEGRRKATGELKGASAKSARRQEEKRAKSKVAAEKPPAPKKPSARKPAAKKPSTDVAPTSAARGERVSKPVDIVARPVQPKAGKSTPGGAKPTQKGPFASGSPRAIEGRAAARPGKELAIRPGSAVARKPKAQSDTANKAKRLGKPVAKAAVVGTAVGGSMALDKNRKDRKASATVGAKAAGSAGKAANAKAFEDSGRKQGANTRTREGIVDNKGRLISRKEFNERAAFRSRFGLDKMTEAQREEWRKKNADKWKAEVKRREEYRSTAGKKRFGKKALRITDKAKTRRSA